MTFVLASNNAKKLTELNHILSEFGFEVRSQREAGLDFEAEETGDTFEANALIKAEAAVKALELPAIADDSGLCVDALLGEPGIRSARYCEGTDIDRYHKLLEAMKGEEMRTARFVSAVACVFPNGDKLVVRGVCEGSLLHEPRGEGGFGYDPIFLPQGFDKSMAELSAAEKNVISHRGLALQNLKIKLREYYANK